MLHLFWCKTLSSLFSFNSIYCLLGEDAPVNELVDFIFAAQIAGSSKTDADDPTHGNKEKKEV